MNFIFGLVAASVVWVLVLMNNKKKLGDHLQAPNKFYNGVMNELSHMKADVRAEILAVLDRVNQNIGK